MPVTPSFYNLDDFYKVYEIDSSLKSEGIVVVDQTFSEEDYFSDYRQQFEGLLLGFMLEGTMNARIHFMEYEIKKNEVAIVLPQLIIEPLRASNDAKMITIGLSMDFLSGFPILREFITNDQIRWHPIIRFGEEDQHLQQELALLLQKFFLKTRSTKKIEVLQYLIFAIITFLSESYSGLAQTTNLPKSRKHEIIDNFYVLISKYATQQRNVKFYAEKLHLTPQYLTTVLKSETGKSILQWIDHVVMIHAKSFLKSSNLSVKEISNELHFGDTSLFCRYFKKHTGISPKGFRNRYYSQNK